MLTRKTLHVIIALHGLWGFTQNPGQPVNEWFVTAGSTTVIAQFVRKIVLKDVTRAGARASAMVEVRFR